MIRNLKILLLAGLAVTALGASAAQATTPAQFTAPGAVGTTTLHLRKDGTGTTAHQVFKIENAAKTSSVSFTCEEIEGTGTITSETALEAIITTPNFTSPAKKACTVAGQEVAVVTNTGCDLTVAADGTVAITDEPTHNCNHSLGSSHEAGKEPITVTTGGFNCTVEVGTQTLKTKVTFHALKAGVTVANNEGETITVTAEKLKELKYNSFGTGCPFGTTENGEYITGNTIVEGTKASGAEQIIRWDPAVP